MIAHVALLLAAQSVQPLPDAPPRDAWDGLPVVRLQATPAELNAMYRFVADEVAAGRCAAGKASADGTTTLRVEAVVRRLPDGRVDAVRPQAIGCSTVEQYAAGIIQRLMMRPAAAAPPVAATWYRTGIVFTWTTSQPHAQ